MPNTQSRNYAPLILAAVSVLFMALFFMAEIQRGQQEAAVKRLSYQLTVTLGQQFAEICEKNAGNAPRSSCRADAKQRAREFVADLAAPY